MSQFPERRKYSNVRITSKYHMPFLGCWVLVCMVLVTVFIFGVIRYEQLWSQHTLPHDDTLASFEIRQSQTMNRLILTGCAFLVGILLLALITAHRIAGPYIALLRTFDAIRGGDLNYPLRFRKYDRLEDVADAFNELMKELRDKIEHAPLEPTALPEKKDNAVIELC